MKRKSILRLGAIMIAALFTLGLTNCEKDKSLSDFVLGKWQSQEFPFGDVTGVFTSDFKSGSFTYTIKVGNTSVESSTARYTVDNKLNTITLPDPDFSGKKSGDPIMRTFNIEWAAKGRTMTWTPDANSGHDFFVWTRK